MVTLKNLLVFGALLIPLVVHLLFTGTFLGRA